MIYTLTLNPSLDYFVSVSHFLPGCINRTSGERLFPGGKGINVSLVLASLGIDNTALGFVAGKTGELFESMLASSGIDFDFVHVQSGATRINVKIESNNETEINACGPDISPSELDALFSKLAKLKSGDTLVMAGSVPPTLPKSIYADILELLRHSNIRAVVDTTGEALTLALKHNPFLIKPNHIELGEIFGRHVCDDADILDCAKALQNRGAQNVLVSKGADGALLLCSDSTVYSTKAPQGKVVSTVGSGDSAVAGFIAALCHSCDFENALKFSVCAGSASAFTSHLASGDEINRLADSFGWQIKLS